MNAAPSSPRRLAATLLLAWIAAGSLPAQNGATPAPAPAQAPAQAKVEKLAEWPAPKDSDKDKVMALVGQLRKPDPALHEAARKQLVTLGVSAMPLLFAQVTDHAENVNPDLFLVFDELLGPAHAALMARETKKPKVELRRYLIRRLVHFHDADLVPVLVATVKDKDPETSFFASLGALALKQKEQLPSVLAYTKMNWKTVGTLVAEVLPGARSTEAGSWVFEAIAKAPVADQMAGLRLARYLATKDQTTILRTYLQAPDHTVKKEAVNAMRVLHGEAPIENLDAFRAIEMAKEWLSKS